MHTFTGSAVPPAPAATALLSLSAHADEIRLLRDIERLMKIDIAVASGEIPADRARPKGARGGNGARNAGRPAGNGHAERRPRPQGGSDNVHRAERSVPSPFAW